MAVDNDDPAGPQKPACDYRLGLSNHERNAAQHAVRAKQKVSLCGEAVSPLPTLGWCLPFLPTTARACAACVHLAEQSAEEGAVPSTVPLPSSR